MIYVDSNVIIRLVEGSAAVRDPIQARLRRETIRDSSPSVMTSQLSRLECRCRPLRVSNGPVLAMYDVFFTAAELRVLPIDAAVIEKATEIRARLNAHTPDAIHLATAFVAGASTFLTADQDLARYDEVHVEVM